MPACMRLLSPCRAGGGLLEIVWQILRFMRVTLDVIMVILNVPFGGTHTCNLFSGLWRGWGLVDGVIMHFHATLMVFQGLLMGGLEDLVIDGTCRIGS